jgi:putative addiction module component (TIGR02574 family)
MRPEEIRKEIDKLGIPEKLILVEDVWDSIALGNSELTMPEWQKKALDARYKEYKEGKLHLYDWQEIHRQLKDKIK